MLIQLAKGKMMIWNHGCKTTKPLLDLGFPRGGLGLVLKRKERMVDLDKGLFWIQDTENVFWKHCFFGPQQLLGVPLVITLPPAGNFDLLTS